MNLSNTNNNSKPKVTVADIRKSYTADKAHSDKIAQGWVYLVLRPLSFYITPLFVNLGLSANAVTIIGTLHLIAGAACMIMGGKSNLYFILGALLANVWYMYDVIDGNIARYHGKANKFGELFDWWTGTIAVVVFPLSLGIGLYLASINRGVFDFGLELPAWTWLAIGVTLPIASLFRSALSFRGRLVLGNEQPPCSKIKLSPLAILPRAVISFEKPFEFVAACTGLLTVFLAFYTAYNCFVFVAMSWKILKKARAINAESQITSE